MKACWVLIKPKNFWHWVNVKMAHFHPYILPTDIYNLHNYTFCLLSNLSPNLTYVPNAYAALHFYPGVVVKTIDSILKAAVAFCWLSYKTVADFWQEFCSTRASQVLYLQTVDFTLLTQLRICTSGSFAPLLPASAEWLRFGLHTFKM